MTLPTRRAVVIGAASAAALSGLPAWALSDDEARALVTKTIDELKALLRIPGSGESRAPELRRIMESRANMPLIAKFSAGRAWRDMSKDQQTRFTDAFAHSVSVTYARRFDEYSGDPKIELGRTLDAGKKGMLVATPIELPTSETVNVEWLVSDRAGATQIVDIVIEGISMAAQQREEIGAKFERRNNDVEALIRDMASEG